MPSAATAKLEKQASTEAVDPIRQAIIIIEHKIRNLEKRKRKIESYREEQKNGKDLNSDQLTAVAKYEEVQQTLEFARDLCKQFNGIAVDAVKQHKKQARKEALEKSQQEVAKIKEILMVQDVLQNMGQENVREDFLAGRNGATRLEEEDLKYLDDLYSEVSPKHGEEGAPPFQEQLQHSAEHLLSIVEGKSKEIVGTTYAKLKEMVAKIHACGYFDQVVEEVAEEPVEELVNTEAELQNAQEVVVVEEEEYVPEAQTVTPSDTFPQGVNQLQSVTSVSQPTSALPIPNTMVPQAPVSVAPTVAAVESSYFSTAAPTFVPAQAPALQQSRPLNEVISSVNSSFNFLQESELDSPDLSAMLTATSQQPQQSQQRVDPTPPPSGTVVPVAPIPTQTFTNQNFASVTTANVPQQVVYQAGNELSQAHIPGFATTTPNPPPPIPMPPSHHRSISPAVSVATMQQTYSTQTATQQQVATYASQTQQQPQTNVMPNPYATQPPQQQQHQQSQEPVDHQQVTEQMTNATIDDTNEDWAESNPSDWSQQTESQTDWSQQTETQGDWAPSNQNDSFITQSNTRMYGSGRGRMNRGNSRGSSNGYSNNRGRGNYQNGRGGSGGYGYRNNDGGNSNYYQNGYQQRDNFGNNNYGGGYKRGGRGAGSGGASRGMDRGGPRGGAGRGNNSARGNRGNNYIRGGGNKQ